MKIAKLGDGGMVVGSTLVGAISAEITGGDFWKGALQAGIIAAFNHGMEHMEEAYEKHQETKERQKFGIVNFKKQAKYIRLKFGNISDEKAMGTRATFYYGYLGLGVGLRSFDDGTYVTTKGITKPLFTIGKGGQKVLASTAQAADHVWKLNFMKGLGHTLSFASTAMDAYGMFNYYKNPTAKDTYTVSYGKAALNFGFTVASIHPVGLVSNGIYISIDLYGWDKMNEQTARMIADPSWLDQRW